jgi:uncharacterized protein
MRRLLRFSALSVALLGLCFSFVREARAASFNCTRAKSPDEIAVCRNADLSELDAEMGALWFAYRQIPFLMGMSGARRDDAGTFLAKRAACGPRIACLRELYQERNKALREGITEALKDIGRQLQQ